MMRPLTCPMTGSSPSPKSSAPSNPAACKTPRPAARRRAIRAPGLNSDDPWRRARLARRRGDISAGAGATRRAWVSREWPGGRWGARPPVSPRGGHSSGGTWQGLVRPILMGNPGRGVDTNSPCASGPEFCRVADGSRRLGWPEITMTARKPRAGGKANKPSPTPSSTGLRAIRNNRSCSWAIATGEISALPASAY